MIELDPENSKAHNSRGTAKRYLDDLNGAYEDWIKAARLGHQTGLKNAKKYCEDDVEALLGSSMTGKEYLERSLSRRQTGNDRGALSDINKCIELGYELSFAYKQRAVVREKLNDINGAIADLTKVVELRSSEKYNSYIKIADLKKIN